MQPDQTYERERKNLIEEDEEGTIREGDTEGADRKLTMRMMRVTMRVSV